MTSFITGFHTMTVKKNCYEFSIDRDVHPVLPVITSFVELDRTPALDTVFWFIHGKKPVDIDTEAQLYANRILEEAARDLVFKNPFRTWRRDITDQPFYDGPVPKKGSKVKFRRPFNYPVGGGC